MVIQILGRKVLEVSFGSRTVFLARNPEMGKKAQNCWNNIEVIPLNELEIKVIYMWSSNEMLQTLF